MGSPLDLDDRLMELPNEDSVEQLLALAGSFHIADLTDELRQADRTT